jgi:hypothetical protein
MQLASPISIRSHRLPYDEPFLEPRGYGPFPEPHGYGPFPEPHGYGPFPEPHG